MRGSYLEYMWAPITVPVGSMDYVLLSQYLWVRLDEGLLSLSTCRSDWMEGSHHPVPVGQGLLSQYMWVAWMGAPITVPVGLIGWGLLSTSPCGSDWIRGSYCSTNRSCSSSNTLHSSPMGQWKKLHLFHSCWLLIQHSEVGIVIFLFKSLFFFSLLSK